VNSVLVIAPHPDDETLGCGGTLLRHKAEGSYIHWLIMTGLFEQNGFDVQRILSRKEEIQKVAENYSFDSVLQAGFPTTRLDEIPLGEVIGFISNAIRSIKPDTIYLPYSGDVHTDHGVVFTAALACTKSFRYPYVKKVRVYETLSETEFNIRPDTVAFKPNLWIDITFYLANKIKIMNLYEGEMNDHPFPRSEKNLNSLATFRGATAGCEFAEAFISIKEVV